MANPPADGNLTAAQQAATVVLTFTNKNQIEITFGVDNSGNPNQSGRNLYIDGRGGSTQDGYDPINDPSGAVPEPTAYSLLIGLAALGLTLSARRPRVK